MRADFFPFGHAVAAGTPVAASDRQMQVQDSNLAEPLVGSASAMEAGTKRGPMRATRAAALAAERQRLGSRLWKVGVLVRLITLLNGLLLVGTASYMVWREVSLEEEEGSKEAGTKHSPFEGMLPDQVIEHLPANVVLRTVLRRSMAILAGVAMIALEVWTAAAEGATRAALGLAFGPGGRFCLFCLAALLCAPMVLSPPRPPPPSPRGSADGPRAQLTLTLTPTLTLTLTLTQP